MTVGELFDEFDRLGIPDTVAPQTRSAYRWSLEAMRPALGTRRLDQLKVLHIEAMLGAMVEGGAARASIARHRSALRRALRWAQRREWIVRNVADLAELPPGGKAPRRARSLTPDEARALLAVTAIRQAKVPRTDRTVTEPRRLEALWVLSLSLGLRPGEVVGLLWPAVNLADGVVHIRTSMRYDKGEAVSVGEVKTSNMGRGRRTLVLPRRAHDALKRHASIQRLEREAAGDAWPAEWCDLVFVSEAGTPLNASNLRRELDEMTAEAGIDRVTRYDLRHSAATLMAAAGARIEDIADALGHEDLRMARTVYVHATGRPIATAAEVLGDVLG